MIPRGVSKATLDAYCSARSEYRQFENAAAGLISLFRWASSNGVLIVFEASGAYHRDMERMLTRWGLAFGSVNPWQARRFAEASRFAEQAGNSVVDFTGFGAAPIEVTPLTQSSGFPSTRIDSTGRAVTLPK